MKTKYKSIVNITNYRDDKTIMFGCYFDYNNIRTNYFKFFNKLITINTYRIKIKPTYIVCNIKISCDTYINNLNARLHQTKNYIKQNNKLIISLVKYLIAINISNYKDYNIYRVNKKLENIVLE